MDFLDRIKINRYIKLKNYKNLVAVLNKMDEKDIEVIFQGLNRESVNDLLSYLYQFYMGRERFIILLAIAADWSNKCPFTDGIARDASDKKFDAS